jgi:RNA polymerase sigma factor (sigma-70 family)
MSDVSTLTAREGSKSDSSIDNVLKQYDAYIFALAREAVPRHFGYSVSNEEELSLEIDELAQRSRIKLWQALQKRHITSPKGYIQYIVHSECIDLIRQRRSAIPLPLNEEGELSLGDVLFTADEEARDPAGVVEQRERLIERLTKLVDVIEKHLPKRQRQAILCSLKARVDDIDQLEDTLATRQISLDAIQYPVEQKERLTLRVSCSLARRTIAQSLDIDMSCYKRAGMAL